MRWVKEEWGCDRRGCLTRERWSWLRWRMQPGVTDGPVSQTAPSAGSNERTEHGQ